ncbi:hypothetical protein A374_06651 [Fictibacillus macauensis ZFHKF-1]|uniref:EVE domain-containing protein n=1 Tax=Fictibacillus macauensis ZFHKF-1 TaxID=1196324 RepID=I8UHF8_9BACL|nr:hypothetical protein [Fictibacillus macauensis]EIT86258.1 hypothetical protein A374_06651 [Fictibacillus macauensis ZFHKF-1]
MKHWLITAIPEYNVAQAFKELGMIDRTLKYLIKKGDVVYIYVGGNVRKIIFKALCVMEKVPQDQWIDDSAYYAEDTAVRKRSSWNTVRLFPLYNFETELTDELSLEALDQYGQLGMIRGARILENSPLLLEYIHSVEQTLKQQSSEQQGPVPTPA